MERERQKDGEGHFVCPLFIKALIHLVFVEWMVGKCADVTERYI